MMANPQMRNRAMGLLAALVAVTGLGGAASAEEASSPREQTVALLQEIAAEPSGFSLRAWVNDGSGGEIPIGHQLEYHFIAERDAHLTVLHLDSHGVATLIHPNAIGSSNRVEGSREHTFPAATDGFTVLAEPPVGQEQVLVLATAEPIDAAALGLSLSKEPIAVVEAAAVPALARRLQEIFLAVPTADRAVARFEQRIAGRSAEGEYDSVDIVSYFTTRTRSIRRPKLDLHVHFETGSDQLDSLAKRNLDSVAQALRDSRLREMRFTVSGHTDDVGDEDYNDDLSRRRAISVVGYLTEVHSIEQQRLEVSYFGEDRPLERGTTPEARALNRRVEFQLLR
jgi:outer membrane protein OmpA-like peptidoglycan-associated protein